MSQTGTSDAGAAAITLPGVVPGVGLGGFVDGIVDHQVLGIYHVRGGPHQLAWDLGFLALGLVLVLVGSLVRRTARPFPAVPR